MKIKSLLLCCLSLLLQNSLAQAQEDNLCQRPFQLIKANQPISGIVTNQTVSLEDLTIPSLWWDIEQFDPFGGELIEQWIAYPQERLIDLIVNRQLWALMDYAKRYSYVNRIGIVAHQEYDYSLRVFSKSKRCLATYTCEKTTDHSGNCSIRFDSLGLEVLEKQKK